MNEIERMYRETQEPEAFAREYLRYLTELLSKLDTEKIALFIQMLIQARERDANIFFIGNGGSASTASHFANDISLGTRSSTKPFRAQSLCDNISVITAIGNDYGYDQIFVRQLKNFLNPGDVLVAISASGNSSNIIEAVEYANLNGAFTVGLTGFDGGGLKDIVQLAIYVITGKGEYGPVEDIHMILDHLVGAFLMNVCRSEVEAGNDA